MHPTRQKPKLLKIMDIAQIGLIIIFITFVGAYYQSRSSAATYVSGRVLINGVGVNDVWIDGCSFNTGYGVAAGTNAQGYFSFVGAGSVNQGYCVRIFATDYLPASDPRVAHNAPKFSGLYGPSTAQNPGLSINRYEWQVFGKACYNNTADAWCRADLEAKYDRPTDTDFSFSFSSPPPPAPAPAPAPSPSPLPVPAPSTKPKSPSGGGSSNKSPGTTTQAIPDTKAPTAPTEFAATKDDEHKSILLKWKASTDDFGVTGYRIERSTDQQNWAPLAESVTETSYEDLTPSFGDKNYYRIQAFDAAGNKSDYATAETTSSEFQANVFTDTGATITSDDEAIELIIPAGSVENNLFCDFRTSKDILGPNTPNYRLVGGPYELICRNEAGENIASFSNKSFKATVNLVKLGVGKSAKLAYFGQKENDWLALKVVSQDKKNHTETVDLDGHTVLSIMQKNKTASIWATIFKILAILVGLAFIALLALRFRFKHKLENQYEDYMKKSHGY